MGSKIDSGDSPIARIQGPDAGYHRLGADASAPLGQAKHAQMFIRIAGQSGLQECNGRPMSHEAFLRSIGLPDVRGHVALQAERARTRECSLANVLMAYATHHGVEIDGNEPDRLGVSVY